MSQYVSEARLEELINERDSFRKALEHLSLWSLPRWDPSDPQTEGEAMRLYALGVLAAILEQPTE